MADGQGSGLSRKPRPSDVDSVVAQTAPVWQSRAYDRHETTKASPLLVAALICPAPIIVPLSSPVDFGSQCSSESSRMRRTLAHTMSYSAGQSRGAAAGAQQRRQEGQELLREEDRPQEDRRQHDHEQQRYDRPVRGHHRLHEHPELGDQEDVRRERMDIHGS